MDAAVARVGHVELPETAASYGAAALRVAAPAAFAELVEAYGALLDRALEHRAYRVQSIGADPVRALADRLGFFWARPRDLVEVHLAALEAKAAGAPARADTYAEEGRLLLLELMGGLASHYRKLSLGRGG